jgi:hypothetical protein
MIGDIIIQKIDRKLKERARMMYFGDYELTEISNILDVDLDTIRFFVFGESGSGSNENCWFQLKKKLNPTSVAIYIKDKISILDKTAGMALSIVHENLKRIQRDLLEFPEKVLTIDDTRKLASLVLDMDKMVRLESGQATQIIENIGLSRAEAVRILQEDPFAMAVTVSEDADDCEAPSDEMSTEAPPWK